MKSASVKKKGLPLAERLHRILFPNEDKRKVKKLVESRGFDMFIMSVILVDAAVLGLLSSPFFADHWEQELFILDRLFMGIFIVEMILKIYAMGRGFFQIPAGMCLIWLLWRFLRFRLPERLLFCGLSVCFGCLSLFIAGRCSDGD